MFSTSAIEWLMDAEETSLQARQVATCAVQVCRSRGVLTDVVVLEFEGGKFSRKRDLLFRFAGNSVIKAIPKWPKINRSENGCWLEG